MAFKSIPGIEGKVFVPEEGPRTPKHLCQDCYVCQQCGDDRCRLCRADGQTARTDAFPPGNDRPSTVCKGCPCR